jgi:TorA maturation chaperone TorD
MIKKETSSGSALLNPAQAGQGRTVKYKILSAAFLYPDNNLFDIFPDVCPDREKLQAEYDRLFRAKEIWLYTTEYLAENEFQRADCLADIMGFYRAFGMDSNKDRPDALPSVLEFMYYLIFKEQRAQATENALICLEAQKKFFTQYVYSPAKKIAETIMAQTQNNFYKEMAEELLEFIESEKKVLAQ